MLAILFYLGLSYLFFGAAKDCLMKVDFGGFVVTGLFCVTTFVLAFKQLDFYLCEKELVIGSCCVDYEYDRMGQVCLEAGECYMEVCKQD